MKNVFLLLLLFRSHCTRRRVARPLGGMILIHVVCCVPEMINSFSRSYKRTQLGTIWSSIFCFISNTSVTVWYESDYVNLHRERAESLKSILLQLQCRCSHVKNEECSVRARGSNSRAQTLFVEIDREKRRSRRGRSAATFKTVAMFGAKNTLPCYLFFKKLQDQGVNAYIGICSQ